MSTKNSLFFWATLQLTGQEQDKEAPQKRTINGEPIRKEATEQEHNRLKSILFLQQKHTVLTA